MLHGRIVRPRGQGAYGAGHRERDRRRSTSARSARIGDARVVRRGDFLGVVASREYDAIEAAARLKVVYREPPRDLRAAGTSGAQMRELDSAGQAPARDPVRRRATSTPRSRRRPRTGERDLRVPLPGPHADRPELRGRGRDARTARSCSRTRRTPTACARVLAAILGLPPSRDPRASTGRARRRSATGRRGSTPASRPRCMSQLAGAPVRLQFMRWDEHGWDNYSPAVLADLRGGVDANGKLVAFDYTAFGIPEMSMTAGPTSQHVGIPLLPPGLGSASVANSGTQYDIPNRRVTASRCRCSTRSSRRPRCARRARRRRRSRPSSSSTSSRTRPGSTRTSSACRTSRRRR